MFACEREGLCTRLSSYTGTDPEIQVGGLASSLGFTQLFNVAREKL